MPKIRNITIEFSCPEQLGNKLFCRKCSHRIIDFTASSKTDLEKEIRKSDGMVCGRFNRSQLSTQFLMYAAATFLATSMVAPTHAQEVNGADSVLTEYERMESENDNEVYFGMILEQQAMPIDGYSKFYEEIAKAIKYPAGLSGKGKVFVQFTIDTTGRMTDVKVLKGLNELADKEAVRVLSTLNYPFVPGRQRGKPIRTRLVLPILFDTTKNFK